VRKSVCKLNEITNTADTYLKFLQLAGSSLWRRENKTEIQSVTGVLLGLENVIDPY
jgi:hypothetical protein